MENFILINYIFKQSMKNMQPFSIKFVFVCTTFIKL